jgi:hypothetical protein
MTSPSRARRRAGAHVDGVRATSADPKVDRPLPEPKPFRPRRTLFVVLMIVFALWVAGLLSMYFTTVNRHRHQTPPSDEQLDVR